MRIERQVRTYPLKRYPSSAAVMTASIRPVSWLTGGETGEFSVRDTWALARNSEQDKRARVTSICAMFSLRMLPTLRRLSCDLSTAWCIARSDLRNLSLLSLDLLHIDAILLRSSLRLLTAFFVQQTLMRFMVHGIFLMPYRVL